MGLAHSILAHLRCRTAGPTARFALRIPLITGLRHALVFQALAASASGPALSAALSPVGDSATGIAACVRILNALMVPFVDNVAFQSSLATICTSPSFPAALLPFWRAVAKGHLSICGFHSDKNFIACFSASGNTHPMDLVVEVGMLHSACLMAHIVIV